MTILKNATAVWAPFQARPNATHSGGSPFSEHVPQFQMRRLASGSKPDLFLHPCRIAPRQRERARFAHKLAIPSGISSPEPIDHLVRRCCMRTPLRGRDRIWVVLRASARRKNFRNALQSSVVGLNEAGWSVRGSRRVCDQVARNAVGGGFARKCW